MIRYVANFVILAIYSLFFWFVMRLSRRTKVLLLTGGFIVGASSVLLVGAVYLYPYVNLRNYAYFIEEVCKFILIFIVILLPRLRNIFQEERHSIPWFGVMVGSYFGFLENFSRIETYDVGLDIILKRGITSWPMHMIYTLCSAYGLQLIIDNRKVWGVLFLAMSIFLHLLFNYYIAPYIPH